ncbi:QacE family quaternary ammonium compound efflux SMR transporter [Izhakiella australiensis]|uniref:Guanidinium exporter n=1 Tax=Izhakiella australiensis TaxID=1926881 RepID=A0A1S8YQD4_9GAMM|nr:multidrug efflux SMR transporter [Izhakiella australiensis]OON41032.1 QacE family quaternary ammonium compound efflux SMR transporter [Izhakiella australiensis]
MPWIMLVAAGILEVLWAYTMKLSHGFTRPLYAVITLVAVVVSFALLSLAMRSLPLGTAYTIWTGIGAIGSFIIGLCFLGEAASAARIFAAALIVAGLIIMKLAS